MRHVRDEMTKESVMGHEVRLAVEFDEHCAHAIADQSGSAL